MKKLVLFSFLLLGAPLLSEVVCEKLCENASAAECQTYYTCALSTGYVFKHDDSYFKEVYGHGIENIITADGCYYPWESWGIGAKVSYWRAKGRTTFFRNRTCLYEVPLTCYVRKTFDFWSCLQWYASLGGGVMFMKEKSYLGSVHRHKGIGECEIGLNYFVWHCFDITAAFRYLFPRERVCGKKADIGGFDLRAGIGFSY